MRLGSQAADSMALKQSSSRTGYTPPKNLTNYANYLDYRIKAYRDLKHDPIRVQSENNRDLLSQEDDSNRGSISGFGNATPASAGSLAGRRQTIVGRKLKIMTVEKGLLRETKIVQRMIDALLECKVRDSLYCHRNSSDLSLRSSTWTI